MGSRLLTESDPEPDHDDGLPNMGELVGQQFVYFLVGSVLIGWCATLALAPGAAYMIVFTLIAPIAFLAFGWAVVPFSIWYGYTWSSTLKCLFDALAYGLILASCFAWLWPAAA